LTLSIKHFIKKRDAIVKDIRQLSGYGRDRRILECLGFTNKLEQNSSTIKCLIIYPDQGCKDSFKDNAETEVVGFIEFYKQGIKLPVIHNNV
jgi:5-methylcytosine-specific restriction enzyme subunit McrC